MYLRYKSLIPNKIKKTMKKQTIYSYKNVRSMSPKLTFILLLTVSSLEKLSVLDES